MQHAQIAIFKFAIYLEKPETQLFYYAIKTRPTVYGKSSSSSIGRLYCTVLCTCHMMCTCECCTGVIPGGNAETRDNPRFPVYLALMPGDREEKLKPGIIPGNPVYLAGMGLRMSNSTTSTGVYLSQISIYAHSGINIHGLVYRQEVLRCVQYCTYLHSTTYLGVCMRACITGGGAGMVRTK